MNLPARALLRLRRDFFAWRYRHAARAILFTPPLARGDAPFTLLSMVQPRDLPSYLVALKSFARAANPQRVVVVCDPAMGDAERAIIKRHVAHAELRRADEFTHAEMPRGGTWERLCAISLHASEGYVVQLDADTATTGALPEVLAAIDVGSGFVIGEAPGQTCVTLDAASRHARPWLDDPGSPHVIAVAEVALPQVGLPAGRLYVRGCSGFCGFPRSERMHDELVDFSARMRRHIGTRWSDWGTEQVASNYLVANSACAAVLPFPKYATPDAADATTMFWHFIGPLRFLDGRYARVSRMLLPALGAAS